MELFLNKELLIPYTTNPQQTTTDYWHSESRTLSKLSKNTGQIDRSCTTKPKAGLWKCVSVANQSGRDTDVIILIEKQFERFITFFERGMDNNVMGVSVEIVNDLFNTNQ